jgi:hypothetical protein
LADREQDVPGRDAWYLSQHEQQGQQDAAAELCTRAAVLSGERSFSAQAARAVPRQQVVRPVSAELARPEAPQKRSPKAPAVEVVQPRVPEVVVE